MLTHGPPSPCDAAGNRSVKAQLEISTSNTATNIEDVLELNRISFARNVISIENATQGVLDIYNIRGTKVLSHEIATGDNHIDISSLNEGIYIIRYKDIIYKLTK